MTTTRKVPADELIGVAEISEILGIPRTNVTTLMSRRETNRFPEAVAQLRMGGVYDKREVLKWAADRDFVARKRDAREQELVEA